MPMHVPGMPDPYHLDSEVERLQDQLYNMQLEQDEAERDAYERERQREEKRQRQAKRDEERKRLILTAERARVRREEEEARKKREEAWERDRQRRIEEESRLNAEREREKEKIRQQQQRYKEELAALKARAKAKAEVEARQAEFEAQRLSQRAAPLRKRLERRPPAARAEPFEEQIERAAERIISDMLRRRGDWRESLVGPYSPAPASSASSMSRDVEACLMQLLGSRIGGHVMPAPVTLSEYIPNSLGTRNWNAQMSPGRAYPRDSNGGGHMMDTLMRSMHKMNVDIAYLRDMLERSRDYPPSASLEEEEEWEIPDESRMLDIKERWEFEDEGDTEKASLARATVISPTPSSQRDHRPHRPDRINTNFLEPQSNIKRSRRPRSDSTSQQTRSNASKSDHSRAPSKSSRSTAPSSVPQPAYVEDGSEEEKDLDRSDKIKPRRTAMRRPPSENVGKKQKEPKGVHFPGGRDIYQEDDHPHRPHHRPHQQYHDNEEDDHYFKLSHSPPKNVFIKRGSGVYGPKSTKPQVPDAPNPLGPRRGDQHV